MTRVIKIKLSISNAYLIKGRKTILVDTGAPREGIKILRALAGLGIEPKDFSLILHTHAHMDHVGSTLELKRWVDAPTAVHVSDAAMLASGNMGKVTAINLEGRIILPFVNKPFPGVKPDILIKDEISLNEFGVDGRIIFTPGHTTGSISILLKNGEAIIGDLLMGGWLGGNLQPTRPNFHYYAEDMNEVRASIQKLLSYNPQKLYVGHGGPLDAATVRQFIARDIQSVDESGQPQV